jgi:hypothetical protein
MSEQSKCDQPGAPCRQWLASQGAETRLAEFEKRDPGQAARERLPVPHRSSDDTLEYIAGSLTTYTEPFRSMAAELLNFRRAAERSGK